MSAQGVAHRRARGATLAVGLILLALVTLLGLAGASAAHVENQLAQNELFRENAASAASAGLEIAIRRIVNSSDPTTVPAGDRGVMPRGRERWETTTRFAGLELALPQAPAGRLAGAHFEIISTGFAARGAVDRQRAAVMLAVDTAGARALPCAPESAGVHCYVPGELARLGWQRVSAE